MALVVRMLKKKRVLVKVPRKRKSRVPKSLAMKPYSYVFKLPSQVFVSTAASGTLGLSTSAQNGQAPLTTSPANMNIVPSSSGIANFFDVSLACPFRLSDILNNGVFTSMYDAYKLTGVKLELEYLNNVSAVNSTGLMPSFYHYWDQDDSTVPTAVSIQQKQGVKRRHFNGQRSMKCSGHPKITMGLATSAGPVSGVISKAQYIDCIHPDALHYALKMLITDVYLPGSSAVIQAFRFNWTYNVSFRAPITTA
jgi:hypothetical protein